MKTNRLSLAALLVLGIAACSSGDDSTSGDASSTTDSGNADAATNDVGTDARETGSNDAQDASTSDAHEIGGDSGGSTRPSYNTGVGFYVGTDDKLYDANGVPFSPRGVNRTHYDSGAATGIANSKSNVERWVLYWANGATAPDFVTQLTKENHDHQIVAIPGVWETDDAHGKVTLTCNSTAANLTHAVDEWVDQAAAWKTIERWSMINIANEWGPAKSTVWRDSYVDAISRMRAAGYGATLVIDAGGCGQDADDIITYGKAVFDSDPQKNVLFSIHVYGNVQDGQAAGFLAKLKATGLPLVVGEFGPGRNIGPSPTNLSPVELMTAADGVGFGWIAWSWDDNDQSGASSDDNGFAMVYHNDSAYTSSADLTTFGKQVVLDATHGLQAKATPATIFP